MTASFRPARLFALAAIASLATVGAAFAGGNGPLRMPAENWKVPYSASPSAIPACTDLNVQARIASHFASAQSSYWNSTLTIVSFDKVRAVAFRPWGLDYIPRLFCTGEVVTSDGQRRSVDFFVGEDTGIIGATWGVEFCIGGIDPNHAYSPACKMARP